MSSTDDTNKMQAQWDEARTREFIKAVEMVRDRFPKTLERLHESEMQDVENAFLKGIAAMVDGWLEDMVEDNRVYGAVNWGDLQVVDVIRCRSALTDQEWIAVVIEEASPDCGLPGPIYEKLKAEYPMLEFEVRCEW